MKNVILISTILLLCSCIVIQKNKLGGNWQINDYKISDERIPVLLSNMIFFENDKKVTFPNYPYGGFLNSGSWEIQRQDKQWTVKIESSDAFDRMYYYKISKGTGREQILILESIDGEIYMNCSKFY